MTPVPSSPEADAAYQGRPGAFSEDAARAMVGVAGRFLPCDSLAQVFGALQQGRATSAVVAVENSLAGAVPGAAELLAKHSVFAVAECVQPIDHALIGVPGRTVREVRQVMSHPVALAQCQRFFDAHPHLEPVPASDTAGAVADVLSRRDPRVAAIASRRAATLYGGAVLRSHLADRRDNVTRFLLVTRLADAQVPPFRVGWKTSVVCTWPNEPGALVRGLSPLVGRGLNLSRIESRPTGHTPFEYQFFLDIDPVLDVETLREALANLQQTSRGFRVLGHYPTTRLTAPAAR